MNLQEIQRHLEVDIERDGTRFTVASAHGPLTEDLREMVAFLAAELATAQDKIKRLEQSVIDIGNNACSSSQLR